MTAVGTVARQFMGVRNTSPLLRKAEKYLAKKPPDWIRAARGAKGSAVGDYGFYYWYYGTLAMFQQGGPSWKAWNKVMKKMLLRRQYTTGKKDGSRNDVHGSWKPVSWADRCGGRVMTTAMGAMTLEVYYRYLPMYAQ
jgi:hypothetical protein